jgi:acetamidase/formamidase
MMQSFDMTEDQAITAITIACDFGITQVVDGNFGVHALIPKKVFKMAE